MDIFTAGDNDSSMEFNDAESSFCTDPIFVKRGPFKVKKWHVAGLLVMICFTFFNVVYGAQTLKLIIKGEQVDSDVPVQIIDGRTLVPLRTISEYLNEEIHWNEQTRTVTVASDLWEQDVLDHLSRDLWVYARNVIIRFLIAFDEMDVSGRELVSEDFDTNIIGPEVVIPLGGVGSEQGTFVDFKFVDAKIDQDANELFVRVKLWKWSMYFPDERKIKWWDFTIDLDRSKPNDSSFLKITKIWQVDEKQITSYHAFPGLKFE